MILKILFPYLGASDFGRPPVFRKLFDLNKTLPLVFLSQIFRYFPAFQVVILVEHPVLFVLGKCLLDSYLILLISPEV